MKFIKLFSGEDVLVDDEDYEKVNQYKWSKAQGRRGCLYAKCNYYPFLMHLMILGEDTNTVVDHIDLDGLNNMRKNLRRITNAQNIGRQPKNRGKFKYKGVQYIGRLDTKPWRAEITVDGMNNFLGYYATDEEAARAYDLAAIAARGKYAGTNFPHEDYGYGR